tara:strand:+ start:227 stop:412 length:186 start_codon:yes stop_codon:yes gene_type:complete
MKTIYFFLSSIIILHCGCVSRTITEAPIGGDDSFAMGLISEKKVIEKKWIWIWEYEYKISK